MNLRVLHSTQAGTQQGGSLLTEDASLKFSFLYCITCLYVVILLLVYLSKRYLSFLLIYTGCYKKLRNIGADQATSTSCSNGTEGQHPPFRHSPVSHHTGALIAVLILLASVQSILVQQSLISNKGTHGHISYLSKHRLFLH